MLINMFLISPCTVKNNTFNGVSNKSEEGGKCPLSPTAALMIHLNCIYGHILIFCIYLNITIINV